MQIVKRKYIIKTIALIIVFFAVISGIFIQNSKQKLLQKKSVDSSALSIITNIFASFEIITQSFEKGFTIGSFVDESKEIYAQCKTARSLIFICDYNFENTAAWLTELTEYAKSDMTDCEKNQRYYSELTDISNIFISVCSNYKNEESIKQIEQHFLVKKDSKYYKNILNTLESQYSLLEKQIIADRKDISQFAKNILNFPLSPPLFKGNYTSPKSISYAVSNSYADIFPSGKILSRMAAEDTSVKRNDPITTSADSAKEYLNLYAPYAENCIEVYSYKTDELIYYIFCPEKTLENAKIINYNEPIKLGLSLNDYTLKAFDATKYLKNHGSTQLPDYNISASSDRPEIIKNLTVISEKAVLRDEQYYLEYKLTTESGTVYYCITSSENQKGTIYLEKEYLQFMGLL